MRTKKLNPEEAMKEIQQIFKRRGKKALEIARTEALEEKTESQQASEALRYFMNEYWHDFSRPALLSLVCEAAGGNPELTTPIAVPLSLISGAIDIHDDIIDQSESKGGRPTVYGKFGKEIALLIGDALLFKGLILLDNIEYNGIPPKKKKTIVGLIKSMFFELGDAEAVELSMRRRVDVTPEAYVQMLRKKAADVEAHTRISAILGNATAKTVQALGEYGRLLGMLIIMRDDWIDVLDLDESLNRIKNECLPLPVLYALQEPSVKSKLISIINKRERNLEEAENILREVKKSHAFGKQQALMERLAGKAESNLKILKSVNRKNLQLLITATLPFAQKSEIKK